VTKPVALDTEQLRKKVHSLLLALSAEERRRLRARFGITMEPLPDDDAMLRELARDLAHLKRKKRP
jgi:DNA-directed RNA polymerase sigma subunit (sigma70/sigma32)